VTLSVKHMKIRILKSVSEYEETLAEIERMMAREDYDSDDLELLALLVRDYEEKHYRIDMLDPVEAIMFRMEQMGLTRKDLERYIGSRSKVSEVMSGKRRLSIGMIRALHEGLGIPAEVLIGKPDKPELEDAA
jgi:HTH-type transcriptional regulator / antitoxin HigA